MRKPKFNKGDKVIIVGPDFYRNYYPKYGLEKGDIVEPSFYGNYWPSYGLEKGDIAEVLVNEPDKDGDIKIKSKEGYWRYWPEENLAPATRAQK